MTPETISSRIPKLMEVLLRMVSADGRWLKDMYFSVGDDLSMPQRSMRGRA